jgi:N-acetyl sugar amidotransferase
MILSSNDPGYRQCSLSVMDNIADPDITFDENGICNYYYDYKLAEKRMVFKGSEGRVKLSDSISRIHSRAKAGDYDCVLGLSGGADSTYLAYLAKREGLKPLIVHFDYGWNSETAVKNVENAVSKLNFDLYTYVMDWPEFKDLLRSYFLASVLDLDVPADHMIFGALFKVAEKYNIKTMLSGHNVVTEHVLPRTWNYNKFDIVNLRNIHRKFGTKPLKNLPALGLWQTAYYQLVLNIESVQLLNYVDYNKAEVKRIIQQEVGWTDYGGKHHESVFTRFYQGYILPEKFHIDKRKAHLSNLVFSGQLGREEALDELKKPTYDTDLQKEDKIFVAKKLDFTPSEFKDVLKRPNVSHEFYGTDKKQRQLYFKLMRSLKPATSLVKKIRS